MEKKKKMDTFCDALTKEIQKTYDVPSDVGEKESVSQDSNKKEHKDTQPDVATYLLTTEPGQYIHAVELCANWNFIEGSLYKLLHHLSTAAKNGELPNLDIVYLNVVNSYGDVPFGTVKYHIKGGPYLHGALTADIAAISPGKKEKLDTDVFRRDIKRVFGVMEHRSYVVNVVLLNVGHVRFKDRQKVYYIVDELLHDYSLDDVMVYVVDDAFTLA